MQSAGIDTNIVGVIEGLIIFFVGADGLMRYLSRKGYLALTLGRARHGPDLPVEPPDVPAQQAAV